LRHERESLNHGPNRAKEIKRHKVSLDVFWLKDEVLEESANLPAPEVIAQEIAEDLEAAHQRFQVVFRLARLCNGFSLSPSPLFQGPRAIPSG